MAINLRDSIQFVHDEVIKQGSITKGTKEVIDYQCHCSYLDVSGTEFNSAGAEWQQLKGSFRTRYCKFTKNLNQNTKKYKIKYKGALYNIEFATDYKQQHRYIDIKATMVK